MKKSIMCSSKLTDSQLEGIMDKIDDARNSGYEIDHIKDDTVYLSPISDDKLMPYVSMTIKEITRSDEEVIVSLDLNMFTFPDLNGEDSNYADYASGAIQKWLKAAEVLEQVCGKEIRLY